MGYGAACAAIEALTRHLAGELGPSGVRVVCLRPDAIPEDLARHSHSAGVFRKAAERAGLTIEAMLDSLAGRRLVSRPKRQGSLEARMDLPESLLCGRGRPRRR